ncbi:MAG: fructosamine kinase family protein [Gammaproteobacteria bacterium]|nr:fructosamine kinase family protein [Gammaproteobacteria bacterium]
MKLWQHIEQQIEQATGKPFCIGENRGVGGGCINASFQVTDEDRRYFIKTNHSRHADMFKAEAEGLLEMANSGTIKVPCPVCYGEHDNQCYIVMEYLDMGGGGDNDLFGRQLAAMHRQTASQFGWHMDNTIGSTPQPNNQHHDWIEFWRQERLGFQLDLAARNGYGGALQTLGERLMADFPVLFESYQPEASMLHGDLWTGNYGALPDGTPVIFDPAFYYGDREAELAMTTLFGSFSRDFYAAYNEAWPLDDGYATRRTFYNIYHIINHTNLFGGGYYGQAIGMIEQVLGEIG